MPFKDIVAALDRKERSPRPYIKDYDSTIEEPDQQAFIESYLRSRGHGQEE